MNMYFEEYTNKNIKQRGRIQSRPGIVTFLLLVDHDIKQRVTVELQHCRWWLATYRLQTTEIYKHVANHWLAFLHWNITVKCLSMHKHWDSTVSHGEWCNAVVFVVLVVWLKDGDISVNLTILVRNLMRHHL